MKRIIFFTALLAILLVNCKKESPAPDNPAIEITAKVETFEQTSAVISGTISAGIGDVGVCWDTLQEPTIEKNHQAGIVVNGKLTITITGLFPKSKYYTRVYARDSIGTYLYSPTISFTTKGQDVTTFAATNLGLHEATLNGSLNLVKGITTNYWFEYGTTGYDQKTTEQTIEGNGDTNVSAEISELDYHATYNCRLVIRTAGQSTSGNNIKLTTAGNEPTIVSISGISNEINKITLKVIINPNLISTDLTFNWGISGLSQESFTVNDILSSKDTVIYHEITGEITETYQFNARAENAVGAAQSANIEVRSIAAIDNNGNKYFAVKIGEQIWLSANLKVLNYNNGDPIPNISNPVSWGEQTTGALCYYDNSLTNYDVYGALYNWYVISDPRGICPPGWHVASYDEWVEVEVFFGGYTDNAGALKETGLEHWFPENAYATNTTGFTALPGGGRGQITPDPAPVQFNDLHSTAYFWTSESCPGNISAWNIHLSGSNGKLNTAGGCYKYYGLSIRLIKD